MVTLSSCTHNNGDIGPYFGTWKLLSINVDGVEALINLSKSHDDIYSIEPVDVFVTVTENAEFSEMIFEGKNAVVPLAMCRVGKTTWCRAFCKEHPDFEYI